MLLFVAALIVLLALTWLAFKAVTIRSELSAASQVVSEIKISMTSYNADEAGMKVARLQTHAANARRAANDPLWTLVSATPVLGTNMSAVAEIARAADDVATLGVAPMIKVLDSVKWEELVPNGAGTNLEPLRKASPAITSAAYAVSASSARLSLIDSGALLPQISGPLTAAKEELNGVSGALETAASVAQLAPGMLGAESPRTYLLMVQNNAESRASGGIPGALAVFTVNNGKLTLEAQSSAGDVGVMDPVVTSEPEQEQIYSRRLGKFMQDVNLTPHFPTAASSAQAMWERRTGQRVDGVVSIDPVALGYILKATGPVRLRDSEWLALSSTGLPMELNDENVVKTLLSDVYSKIRQPAVQDAYFAVVAQEIFSTLSRGSGDTKSLIQGLVQASEEGRVLVWSDRTSEQSILNEYRLSGSIAGPSIPAAQFGVYFNDGTGAKMDYYVKRTVQLVKECATDGYEQTTVRMTSTNTAPADAATSLPAYVTGDGNFGVPPGSVQTNIVAYGPVQANVETAKIDGQETEFAPYIHSNRPVGVLAIRLAPGESRTVEFTFGKIVQHTEPNVVVTPTVQDVKEVLLPIQAASCEPVS